MLQQSLDFCTDSPASEPAKRVAEDGRRLT
jgi:hypothetical protein